MTACIIVVAFAALWCVLIVGLGMVDGVPLDVHDPRHPRDR